MDPNQKTNILGPFVFLLHWLGGSARTWNEVSRGVAHFGARPMPLDLPGFGQAQEEDGLTIDAAVDKVILDIQTLRLGKEDVPWLIAGHSMGGKIAACVARAAVDGRAGLEDLAGVFLISPSPPGREPMDESKRTNLLRTLGKRTGTHQDVLSAAAFVDDNTGKIPLAAEIRDRSIEDVLRSKPSALSAWLTSGSKQDLSQRVGLLDLPTVVLAGAEDGALGPDAQAQLTLPHFAHPVLKTLAGCGHLAPVERPADVVDHIANFFEGLGISLHHDRGLLGMQFASLIASARTSPQTRALLESRIHGRRDADQRVFAQGERVALDAVCARVLPRCPFDAGTLVAHWLDQPQHDGWRDDRLPQDAEAWRIGLRSLDIVSIREQRVTFAELEPAQQDATLRKARDGALNITSPDKLDLPPHFDAEQMQAWFEDVRGQLTRLYMADPRTMERVGFTGFADEQGFTQIRLGQMEDFESE